MTGDPRVGRIQQILTDLTPPEQRWWLCPNTPPCPHGAALHDIEDLEDTSPRCCFQGCACGRPSVPSTKEPTDHA